MSVVIVGYAILPESTDIHYYHQAKVHENRTIFNFVLTHEFFVLNVLSW